MQSYFKKIKVGDIIDGHHKGIHQVTKVVRRWEDTSYPVGTHQRNFYYISGDHTPNCGEERASLIEYITIYDDNFNPKNSKKVNVCDESYCSHLSEVLNKRIGQTEDLLARMKEVKQKHA